MNSMSLIVKRCEDLGDNCRQVFRVSVSSGVKVVWISLSLRN